MSDIWGADEELPPAPVRRARVNRDFIPSIKLAETPATPMPILQPYEPPKPELAKMPEAKPNEWGTLATAAAKQIWGKEPEKEKPKTLAELLAAAGYALPPTVPGDPAAAAARTLDPSQAPDTGEVQIDPTGVPTGYFGKTRTGESGGNDAAVNKDTGAAGRYQFMPTTAEAIIKANPHLNISGNWRTNAADQEKLMQAYTQQSVNTLKPILGRNPTGGELYMTHLLGHGGGPFVLGNLDRPLTETTSAAARAVNPVLNRFKTGRELLAYFNKNF